MVCHYEHRVTNDLLRLLTLYSLILYCCNVVLMPNGKVCIVPSGHM